MSRYNKLEDPPGPITGCSWFSIVVFTVFALVAFGYALTAFFAQPGQNMRIDLLAYQVTGLSNNLTNETNARIAKDMILMYNVSQLYMDVSGLIDKDMILMGNVSSLQMSIDYIYNVLNITNGTGIEVMQTLMFLNSSVFNLTGDVNMIYNILNTTNNDLSTLNQTVNNLINNVSKTISNGTGIAITDQNAGSYGTISLTNISGVEGTHPFPSSVSVDGQGRITAIANGTEPMTSITIGPGLSVDSMNPMVAGGTLNATSDYLQLQVIIPPGTHTHATVTVDTYGRVTMLSSGSHPVTSVAAGIGMSFATIDSMNPTGTINLSNISGVEGYWVNPAMNVDGQGRIITIMNMSGSGVTSITAGAGLNGGVITTTGTISMPNVGPGAGTYFPVDTVSLDAQGRVTSAVQSTATFVRMWPDFLPASASLYYILFDTSVANADCVGALGPCAQGFTAAQSTPGRYDQFLFGFSATYHFEYKLYGTNAALSATDGPNGLVFEHISGSNSYYFGYSFCVDINFQAGFCESTASFTTYINAGDYIRLRSLNTNRDWISPLSTTPFTYSGPGAIDEGLFGYFIITRIR